MISHPSGGQVILCLAMLNRVNLEVIWFDQDVIEVLLSCSNGYFAGASEIYVSHHGLSELADALQGFPSSVSDIRTVELGTFDPNHADGGLQMCLYCKDSSGCVDAELKLRGGGCKAFGEMESVALRMHLEPAGIDAFVLQLKRVDATIGASAFLPMAIEHRAASYQLA